VRTSADHIAPRPVETRELKENSMKRLYIIFIILISTKTSFGDITYYNNTILTGATTSIGVPPEHILFDDVLVPTLRDPLDAPLAIAQVTVLVSAFPGASGEFSLWNFPVQADGSPGLPPALIDTTTVTFTNAFQQITFGNGSSTLFTVTPNFTAEPGSDCCTWAWRARRRFRVPGGCGQMDLTSIYPRLTTTMSRAIPFFSIPPRHRSRRTCPIIW
jgi:hypothetical protein